MVPCKILHLFSKSVPWITCNKITQGFVCGLGLASSLNSRQGLLGECSKHRAELWYQKTNIKKHFKELCSDLARKFLFSRIMRASEGEECQVRSSKWEIPRAEPSTDWRWCVNCLSLSDKDRNWGKVLRNFNSNLTLLLHSTSWSVDFSKLSFCD